MIILYLAISLNDEDLLKWGVMKVRDYYLILCQSCLVLLEMNSCMMQYLYCLEYCLQNYGYIAALQNLNTCQNLYCLSLVHQDPSDASVFRTDDRLTKQTKKQTNTRNMIYLFIYFIFFKELILETLFRKFYVVINLLSNGT